jgi:hypothetical protein
MAIDDRIVYLVREEVGRVLGAVELTPGDVREGPDWSGRLDELHAELHRLVTKVSALEQQLATLEQPASRARVRKASDS